MRECTWVYLLAYRVQPGTDTPKCTVPGYRGVRGVRTPLQPLGTGYGVRSPAVTRTPRPGNGGDGRVSHPSGNVIRRSRPDARADRTQPKARQRFWESSLDRRNAGKRGGFVLSDSSPPAERRLFSKISLWPGKDCFRLVEGSLESGSSRELFLGEGVPLKGSERVGGGIDRVRQPLRCLGQVTGCSGRHGPNRAGELLSTHRRRADQTGHAILDDSALANEVAKRLNEVGHVPMPSVLAESVNARRGPNPQATRRSPRLPRRRKAAPPSRVHPRT
jgi:hypothetical protein